MAEEEETAFMNKKMDEIKKCANMEGIISKMFDYKIEVAITEMLACLPHVSNYVCLASGLHAKNPKDFGLLKQSILKALTLLSTQNL